MEDKITELPFEIQFHPWENISIYLFVDASKLQYLRINLIDWMFPNMITDDKIFLLEHLAELLNFIFLKFGLEPKVDDNLFWNRLIQNKMIDLRAIIGLLLPFIADTENDDKKHALTSLQDIYLSKDKSGQYIYSNMQYNRCIRIMEQIENGENKIHVIERPFHRDYFLSHFKLLINSLDLMSNKLHVNWVDVLPVRMDNYMDSFLYKATKEKFDAKRVNLVGQYVDTDAGLSWADFYHVIVNHLYHQIANQKWLIFDVLVEGKPVTYLSQLEKTINLDPIWENKKWSQLSKEETEIFTSKWRSLLTSKTQIHQVLSQSIFYFFQNYHVNAKKLIKEGLLIKFGTEEAIPEDGKINYELTQYAIDGMYKVPVDEVYLFLVNQLHAFKATWYYNLVKVQNKNYLDIDDKIYITPKNVYNYAKLLASDNTTQSELFLLSKNWISLEPKFIFLFLYKLLDHPVINKRVPWFNINRYIRRIYSRNVDLVEYNQRIKNGVKKHIVNIVFESLICHGVLSKFLFNPDITDDQIIESTINSTDLIKKTQQKRKVLREVNLNPKNQKLYGKYAYYYLTNAPYETIKPLHSKSYASTNYKKRYFDFLLEDQLWTFTYAMNWISQINLYHHYTHNRILYVTGATGRGKSTEVPKLLMYCQIIIDQNLNGKIICTQPRITPTVENAETIARNMGVPLKEYNKLYETDIPTANYYLQYKHKKDNHVDRTAPTFLRIVTDGTLLMEMKKYPFLTKSTKPKRPFYDASGNEIEWFHNYDGDNIYDILIVDEAHEHNPNMDIILSLAKQACYVNNSLKLVIVSATMDNDEPIYRRYYRDINDNRAYPLSKFIEINQLDRANMDRRIDISPPGKTTQFNIVDYYEPKEISDQINPDNFVDYGIRKTLEIINSTTDYDILLFVSGRADINKAVEQINRNSPNHVICFGYYGELSEEKRDFITKIDTNLPFYSRYKDDINLEENEVKRRLPRGTYKRAVIVATNVAEASITLRRLRYVVDTGYAKVNIYDPIENTNKTQILPISQSSVVQRRGRVGRMADGYVYHLYDDKKLVANKTIYGITNSNIMDTLVDLLKTEPYDFPIITPINDINHMNFLLKATIVKKKPVFSVDELVENAQENLQEINKEEIDETEIKQYIDDFYTRRLGPIEKLIEQKYIPHVIKDPKYMYIYYGVGELYLDKKKYAPLDYYKSEQYLINNHDDYSFQQNLQFISRCHTGYDANVLEDTMLDFFVIHPDENIITRDLYTGRFKKLAYNPSVSPSYYFNLLSINGIHLKTYDTISTQQKMDLLTINPFHLKLPKCLFAFDSSEYLGITVKIPSHLLDVFGFKFVGNVEEVEYIKILNEYYNLTLNQVHIPDHIITANQVTKKLNAIKKYAQLDILNIYSNLLWYAYALPSNNELDVLAISSMIEVVSSIADFAKVRRYRDVIDFVTKNQDENGDIHFIWKIWEMFKEFIGLDNIMTLTQINTTTMINFESNKWKFINGLKLDKSNNLIFLQLYKTGKLNTSDEFYYYVQILKSNNISSTVTNQIKKYIEHISNMFAIEKSLLEEFWGKVMENVFQLQKNQWIYEYEIEHGISEDEEEIIVDWIKTHLVFSKISHRSINTGWDNLYESYIRSHITNLVIYENGVYINISSTIIIEPSEWSRNVKTEKTVLLSSNKTKYLIYHSEDSINGVMTVFYLTPVQIEWAFKLNPIYFFFIILNLSEKLERIEGYPIYTFIRNLWNNFKNLFNKDDLLYYLNNLQNPILSLVVLSSMDKLHI